MRTPWNSPGKNTGVGSHSHLQGILPTQGSNPGLLHCRQILYHLSHQEKQKQFDFLFCYRFSQVRPPHPQQEVGFLLIEECVCVCSISHIRLFVAPWTAACQDPLSMGFPRQEYWSGLPCPAPGGLTDTGINTSVLHWQAGYLLLSHLGSPSSRNGSCQ